MTRSHTIIDSPIDPITLVAEDGALCGLYMHTHKGRPHNTELGERTDHGFDQVIEELEQYFTGERKQFDVAVAPRGSQLQLQVWQGLRTIGYGETLSYGALAERIGKPGAARLVGSINGQNPISIIVPCHRVIGANGKLVGYGGGIDRKEFLLDLERPVLEQSLFA